MMRITVSGKGGTGKTVIAAAMACLFARRGHQVLAVDCDDNPMLPISLGVPLHELEMVAPIPTDFWQALERPGQGRVAILSTDATTLTSRHCVAGPDGVSLLAGPVAKNEGCTHDAGVRGMLGVMLGTHAFETVITDFEAGVMEPASGLGGILNPAEVLLVVSTPSPVAEQTAARVVQIAREADVPRIYGIANQVRNHEETAAVERAFAAMGVDCLATIPYDEAVAEADRQGQAIVDLSADSPATEALAAMVDRLDAKPAPVG